MIPPELLAPYTLLVEIAAVIEIGRYKGAAT